MNISVSRQKLLPLFLKEVQERVPDIEDFLKGNGPGSCDLGSLKTAFCATSTICGTARIVNADSIAYIAGRVEKLLHKHLKNKTSPSWIEFDALNLAQEKIRALADCLNGNHPEPPGILKGAEQVLALAEAFPGRSVSAKNDIDGLAQDDPFCADAMLDAPDGYCSIEKSQVMAVEDSSQVEVSFNCPDDIFAEDDLIELPGNYVMEPSSACRLNEQGGGSADPFEDDPVFDPVTF